MFEAWAPGPEGCTVGVVRIPGGMLFFKNRDRAGSYLAERVTAWQSTPEVHLLRGFNLQTGALEGVSIGLNRHRVCVANTHVLSTPDMTYDLLCEALVQQVRQRDDVPRLVAAFMARHTTQGGRILVASPEWAFLVEVLQKQFEIEAIADSFAMTNTFSLLRYRTARPGVREDSSLSRLKVANAGLGTIASAGALKALLRSHEPEKGELSICNHRQDGGGTESSHIIHIQGEYAAWSYLSGFPCENDYHTAQLFPGKGGGS